MVPAVTGARVAPAGTGGGRGGEGEEVLEEVVLGAPGRRRLAGHGRRRGGEGSGATRQGAKLPAARESRQEKTRGVRSGDWRFFSRGRGLLGKCEGAGEIGVSLVEAGGGEE